jgi:hypothetical protein
MCEMAIAADDVDKTMAMYVLLYFHLQCLLRGCCSVALPDSTDYSLAVIRGNIEENMIPSQVLLSPLMIYAMSDLCCISQNPITPPASHLGSEPIQMTTSVTIQLVGDVLVSQRRFHQLKATARAVCQANRLEAYSASSIASIGPPPPEETPVHNALMR